MRRLAAHVIVVAALLAAAFGGAAAVDPAAAVQINAQAMQFAQQNMADQALPLFKLAVSTNPQSAEYWNNLGVCYMRLQRWDLAAAALTRGAAFGDAGAKANLAKVQSYLSAIGSAAAVVDIDAEVGLPPSPNAAPAKSDANGSGSGGSAATKSAAGSGGSGSSGSGSGNSGGTPDGRPAPKFLPKPVYVKPDGLTVRARRRVTRLTLEQLYAPGNERFADGKEPYILTGAMDEWPARKKWTLDWFVSQFGASIVDFYPHNMAKHDTHPYLARMDESIAELRSPSGRYPHDPYSPGTYLQWNVQPADWERLLSDTRLPYFFRRDEEWLHGIFDDTLRAEYTKRVHWRMMLIGSKGAGMFVHMDVLQSSSWQAQVSGAKKWFLCSPTQSAYLYGAGKVDVFNPDYATYPLFAQSDCYEDVVSGGEMVYYPANYWHQTENLGDVNVAFSSTISDDNNYHLVQNELKAECATGKYKWGFSKDLCAALDRLFAFWADRYEQRDRGSCSLSERGSHAN